MPAPGAAGLAAGGAGGGGQRRRRALRPAGVCAEEDGVDARREGGGGARSFQREPTPPEEVAQRIAAEDEHVRRYMYALDTMLYRTGWSVMQGSHVSYAPVTVPWLWGFTRRGSGPGRRR